MREGMKAGVVSRACSWKRCCRSSTPTSLDDAEKSIFWGPVTNMPKDFSAADRER